MRRDSSLWRWGGIIPIFWWLSWAPLPRTGDEVATAASIKVDAKTITRSCENVLNRFVDGAYADVMLTVTLRGFLPLASGF